MTPVERALAYHERSKHQLHQYARALGYLDWATQPDPFRRFEGAPRVALPLCGDELTTTFRALGRNTAIPPCELTLETVATLFELSLGLSAWKVLRDKRWALRCNPSSGNLHPTEGYAVVAEASGLAAGVYHYASREHALERRAAIEAAGARTLAEVLPAGSLIVGLTSIHWREAWKYGERAFRYCQHDLGHAIAAVRYAAATLGWSVMLLEGLGDHDLATLLGLDRAEDFAGVESADREHPEGALLVCKGDAAAHAAAVVRAAPALIAALRGGAWTGKANGLSASHVDWEVIDDVAEATASEATPMQIAPEPPELAELPALLDASTGREVWAAMLFRGRRSAVAFDGQSSIAAEAFYAMLDHLMPRPRARHLPPWDTLPWAPRVHAGILVHRVRGLEQGLYAFERSTEVHDRLRAAMSGDFLWDKPPGCPPHLRLFLLMDIDLRSTAQIVSCHQEIAADGAFSLGMIADFERPLREDGASTYRRLFWEAGVLGHALYLEAEATSTPEAPVRATGIGCYFDDAFHELCGLQGNAFQSLYHFTVGRPVEDTRLSTLPPYEHLGRGAAR